MSLGINSYCYIDQRSTVKIGNYSMVARDCIFMEINDHHLAKYNHKCVFTDNAKQPQDNTQDIEIGNDVWVGRGVKFLPGVKVGDGAIIGAWAVIAKEVPAYAVVVGNPQVIKRYRFTPEQIQKLLELKWWDWDSDKVVNAREAMLDIDGFLNEYA